MKIDNITNINHFGLYWIKYGSSQFYGPSQCYGPVNIDQEMINIR